MKDIKDPCYCNGNSKVHEHLSQGECGYGNAIGRAYNINPIYTKDMMPTPQEVHDAVVHSKLGFDVRFRQAQAAIDFILEYLNNKAEGTEESDYCNCGSGHIVNIYDYCPDCKRKRIVYE